MKPFAAIVLLLFTFSSFAQTKEFTLASDVWPPFTDVEENKSIALDLVKEALNRMDIRTNYEILKWSEVIEGINNGTFAGSAAMWLGDDREEKYTFSNSYLQNQLILVGKKGSDVSAASFAELEGKRIGIVEDYAYGEELFTDHDLSLVKGKNDQHNLERLLSDQVDYMLVDALLIQYLLKYQVNDVSEYLSIGESPIIVKSLHFGLRRDFPESATIIEGFNTEIAGMISDGTYNRILELNWIHADADGDGELELVLEGDAAGTQPPENTYGVYPQETLARKGENPNKYYIGGKMYYNWDDVPDEFKKDLVYSTRDPKNAGIKLDF